MKASNIAILMVLRIQSAKSLMVEEKVSFMV